ncbi:DUF4181 domain-containing protein [Salibacterium salarium]|uniref:DUF4181 domain-containing protein n=1 Tax=Salibacterium salarium TaxID=284579 RepID=A0A428N6P5_9BACI|nr:DUF4181 domain-containing protein [Salibacterium salarium]RSL33952.1 DUF4181 domain-containing protein [Salibacterium salarium]
MEYSTPPGFWIEFIIVMGAFALLAGGIPPLLRRWMGADKKKRFSYNHINDFHKKGDWMIRITYFITFLMVVVIYTNNPLPTLITLAFSAISQCGFQAYVEWKFTENRSNYKVSLIELNLILAALVGVILWLELYKISPQG